MWSDKVFLILAFILHSHSVLSLWSCTEDADCSLTSGSVCNSGNCVCPAGLQLVQGGSTCGNVSPYLTSSCFDDYQCSNLITNFQCRRAEDETEGNCYCQPGFHYLIGRCWKSVDFGGTCTRNEECFGVLRDPFNLVCEEGKCACADGYYERQRGECRKIGQAVGQGCVLDDDCQFTNGACDQGTLKCIDSTNPATFADVVRNNVTTKSLTRRHGVVCDSATACPEPFVCSGFGVCVCPRGYYPNAAGSACLAELGSPATTANQCAGFFAEVIDGVCSCPSNVYYSENMRDCVKPTLRLTDSCVNNEMCHTFGAASRCGPPEEWFIRSCECIPELAIWDAQRLMCRLFAGIGENCVENSDCLAGNMEIECVTNSEGQGICTCPEGFDNMDGLCLTSGLSLGDSCQMTQECTETTHTVCEDGRCSCGQYYQELDGICVPTIGGTCLLDSECSIEHTVCFEDSNTLTCQCDENFLENDDKCWPLLTEITSTCSISAQCMDLLGDASSCNASKQCVCNDGYHLRDGRCWPQTGLFATCSRSSECYLNEMSDRVQCRNSMCQCSFEFPYSEELNTCTGTGSAITASVVLTSTFTIAIALYYAISN